MVLVSRQYAIRGSVGDTLKRPDFIPLHLDHPDADGQLPVPCLDDSILAATQTHQFRVMYDLHSQYRFGVAGERVEAGATDEIPHLDGGIVAGREEMVGALEEGDGSDVGLVTLERLSDFMRGDVEDLDEGVVGGGGKQGIRQHGQSIHTRGVVRQGALQVQSVVRQHDEVEWVPLDPACARLAILGRDGVQPLFITLSHAYGWCGGGLLLMLEGGLPVLVELVELHLAIMEQAHQQSCIVVAQREQVECHGVKLDDGE